jgi:membrane protease YdiL (CAAX protease family)
VWARRLWFGDHGKLRTPWRLILFVVVAAVATQVAGGLIYPIVETAGQLVGLRLILFGWVGVAGLLIAHLVSLRRIDGLPWSAAGLGRAAARPTVVLWGMTLGALAIGIPSLILWSIGVLRVEAQPDGSSLLEGARAALLLAPLAFLEELTIRGYVLTVLREVADWRIAVAATSIVFGLLHVANPGSTAGAVGMTMLAGLMLGTIVVVSNSLYAATAAHLAWNWVMAGVLHAPVSGFGVATPDYRMVDAGPDWVTGGAWGPEAGIGAALGMSAVLGYLYTRRARPRAN